MSKPRMNALLSIAIAAGLLSLPMTWLTVRSTSLRFTPKVNGPIHGPDFFSDAFQQLGITRMSVSGLNGSMGLLGVNLPIWTVVAIAIAACLCQMANNLSGFDFPEPLLWIVAAVALLWVLLPVGLVLFSGQATPGPGWLLGATCAITPVATLFLSRQSVQPRFQS